MNCPNDRYVNDGAICQAVAANLARVGVKINLEVETKGTYFPKILRRDTSFYMLGWTSATVDAHNVLYPIMSTPGEGGRGQFNLGAYSNPKVDELTDKVGLRNRRQEAQRDDPRGHQDPPGRRRPHSAAPAGAELGREEEHRAGAIAGQRAWCGSTSRSSDGGCDGRLVPAGRGTATSATAFGPRRWRSPPALVAFVCVFCAVFANIVAPHHPFDLATLELGDAFLPPSWVEGRQRQVPAGHR